jgi:hypothetical protein
MESPASATSAGSFTELVRTVVQEGQAFVRAEAALLKVEARETATLAAVYLVLITGSGLLLAAALSLAAAAWVLAAHGSTVAALLAAAGVDVFISAVAISYMLLRLRQKASTSETASASERTGEVS